MAADTVLSPGLRSTFAWPLRIARRLLRRCRFVFISPPWARRQLIYDRKQKQLHALTIRDEIDYLTLLQIYGSEDYRVDIFAQHARIQSWYNDAIASGLTPAIYDVGAHAGFSVRYFAAEYREARIIGLEPDQENFVRATRHVAHLENVRLMRAALSGHSGSAMLSDPGIGNWGYRIDLSAAGNVPLITVDELLEEAKVQKLQPFILKLDIEGSEREVFAGSPAWIDEFPLIIIELHDWMLPGEANSRNFLGAISQRDRDFVFVGENIFSFRND